MAKATEQPIPDEAYEAETGPQEERSGMIFFTGDPQYGLEFYRGPAAEHRLTRSQQEEILLGAGLDEDQDKESVKADVVWNAECDWAVPEADVHPAVVERIKKDPSFKVKKG
jgi:hypothetical protein